MVTMSAKPDEKLERQAILWLVRLQSQPADDSLKQACMKWRQYNQAHEQAWQAVQATYSQLQHHVQQVPSCLPVSPAQLLHRSASRMSRRRALGQFGCLLALGLPLGWITHEYTPWQRLGADHATVIGQRASLTLDDGSQLMLNTDSAVRLRFGPDQRLILLDRGEIYWHGNASHSQAARPLRIETAGGSIETHAGQLSIRRQANQASLVHLASGTVQLQGRKMATPVTKTADQLTTASSPPDGSDGYDILLASADVQRTTASGMDRLAWTEGLLVAQDMRLADFLAEVNRYRQGRLDWTPEIADLRISGTYQLHDTDRLLALLPRSLPVEIGHRTRFWTTVRART